MDPREESGSPGEPIGADAPGPERDREEEGTAANGRGSRPDAPAGTRIKESLKLVVEVAALAFLIYLFIFQISIVKGDSMMPSFAEKDRLIIDKLTYRFADVARFDVIVFRNPDQRERDYIKRVLGLPGERVALRGGTLYIDGEPVVQDFTFGNQAGPDGTFGPTELGPDDYFVMGDNRAHSEDSRRFREPVHGENIRGRVWMRIWPLGRWTLF